MTLATQPWKFPVLHVGDLTFPTTPGVVLDFIYFFYEICNKAHSHPCQGNQACPVFTALEGSETAADL
jgi:hypothetical protein